MTDLRYPIGKFKMESNLTDTQRQQYIAHIAETPAKLRAAVARLSDQQLDTPYRPGGWTVRQVVHHLPESHMNAYVRFKLTLTEEQPTIKPYDQEKWAQMEDARTAPIEMSLTLMDALHQRWALVLRALKAADLARTFRHPEMGVLNLDAYLGLYSWHGRHHVAHITSLRERMGWA